MVNNTYIVLSTSFINKHKTRGIKSGPNTFSAIQTKDNRWVTSINAVHEFLDELEGEQVQVVYLTEEDFYSSPDPFEGT